MQNERIVSYQQAADELRNLIISLYGKKIFPRMGKIFADQLFLTGTEAGGYICVLADLDEIHVKRDTAQCALIRLKRADYILKTMIDAKFYTESEAEELSVFFKKIIPAVKGLLVDIYAKIERDSKAMIANACSDGKGTAAKRAAAAKCAAATKGGTVETSHAVDDGDDAIGSVLESISGDDEEDDFEGFDKII